MRPRVVSLLRLGEIERGARHADGFEYFLCHRFVVRRAELALRVDERAADEARRGGHPVAVLEELAEAARGLHRAKQFHDGVGRRTLVLEDPLEVLARETRARADKV